MALDVADNPRRSCPHCASTHVRRIGPLRFALFESCPLPPTMDLVSCAMCGFVFNDTAARQEDWDAYYSQNAYYRTARTAGAGNLGDGARFREQILRFQHHFADGDGRIVDVGCGQGGLVRAVRSAGFRNAVGVDLLAENLGPFREGDDSPKILKGSACALPLDTHEAAVLIYSHILEHAIDLEKLVDEARRVLRRDGLIYVEVPDARQYGTVLDLPFQEFYLEHVNHFGADEVVATFTSRGFRCVDRGVYSMPIGGGNGIPCLFALFRCGVEHSNSASAPPKSFATRGAVEHYVKWCDAHPLLNAFSRLVESEVPLSLWGISQHAMLLLGQTQLGRCQLRMLVDTDPYKQQQRIGDRPIQSPTSLGSGSSDEILIITADRFRDEIVGSARGMSYGGRVLTMHDLTRMELEPASRTR